MTSTSRGSLPVSVASAAARGDGATVRRSTYRRSEEHTSELQSLMRISYAVFCLKKKIRLKRCNTMTYTKKNKIANNRTNILIITTPPIQPSYPSHQQERRL